ncbi:MAG: RtcB family protein [Desulfobacterales bacterium]|nr:RtcB family protein [Desulfobacterales bacterium]
MEINKINDYLWEIPQSRPMNVPARIYSSDALIEAVKKEETFKQLVNVAQLPGIVKYAMAMPDIHWGYGFPIGGVAAFETENGVISPGGVGYDINCGVRLAATGLNEKEIRPKLADLATAIYRDIPSGVGSTGPLKLTEKQLKKVLSQGSPRIIDQGYGDAADADHTEEGGCMANADPGAVSNRAVERGRRQLGTLGSGNHFMEIGVVDTIYDPAVADAFGLRPGHVTLLIHTGSRGLGHQVCDDFLAAMTKKVHQTGIRIPDRQLACMPINSAGGRAYYNAMACAANFAWANRQVLMHLARDVFMETLDISPRELAMHLVYDVCHNIAKIETHVIDGRQREVCVHRKGATRAFAPGHPALNRACRDVGQPILIPGDMGTASYVLVGTQEAMDQTFGSTCHGAGRVMSRKAAKKAAKGRSLAQELEQQGVLVRASGKGTMAEEMPEAYKNVTEVVEAVHGSGISRKVAKLRPVAVVKG